jgi:hypothetical protein
VLYRIEEYASNPRAVVIGDTHVELVDIAIDPTTGVIYALGANGELFRLDGSTGAAEFVGDTEEGSLNALEADVTGRLWAWESFCCGYLNWVDKEVGLATEIGDTDYLSGGDLAFDTDGSLYGVSDNDDLVRISTATGQTTAIGKLPFDSSFSTSGAFGLEVDSDGTMYVGRGDTRTGLAQLFRINKTTGNGSLVGSGSISGASQLGLAGLAFASPGAALPPPVTLTVAERFIASVDWRDGGGASVKVGRSS